MTPLPGAAQKLIGVSLSPPSHMEEFTASGGVGNPLPTLSTSLGWQQMEDPSRQERMHVSPLPIQRGSVGQ